MSLDKITIEFMSNVISEQTNVEVLVNGFEAHPDILYQERNVTMIYNIFKKRYRIVEDKEHSLRIIDVIHNDSKYQKIMGKWNI